MATKTEDKTLEVLYITRKYPPSIGGMERLSFELSQSLSEVLRLRVIAWGYSQKWLLFFIIYAFCRATIYLIIRSQIKVIFIGDPVLSPVAVILKYIFKKKTLVTIHGLDITYPNKLYQKFIVGCLARLDAFICISKKTRQEAIKRGLPEQNCHFIPIGIDSTRFTVDGATTIPKSLVTVDNAFEKKDAVILLTVGRLVKRKGVIWFIKHVLPSLFSAYPQLIYLIVGKGPDRKLIESLIQQSNLINRIHLLENINEKDLQIIYQTADIFVMPNIHIEGDMEGFGIVALEAAASKTCVIASKIEGIEDAIIDQKNGLLIPSEDARSYIDTLSLMIRDKETRVRFAQQAQKFTFENFNWSKITEAYVKIIGTMSDTNAN